MGWKRLILLAVLLCFGIMTSGYLYGLDENVQKETTVEKSSVSKQKKRKRAPRENKKLTEPKKEAPKASINPPMESKDGKEWIYVSETSASIYWKTDIPCQSYIEYGQTAIYDKKSEKDSKLRKGHFHRLPGLKKGEEFHFRYVTIGEDKKEIKGEDRRIKTNVIANAVYLPGDLKGPPYVLSQPDTVYVLTEDITAEGTAFEIRTANGITLDLDGHTVKYSTAAKAIKWDRPAGQVFGVFINYAKNLKIYNGVIKQGVKNTNCAGIEVGGSDNIEVAGITIETLGDTQCLEGAYGVGAVRLHHNYFIDSCNDWIKEGGPWNPRQCVSFGQPAAKIDHNLFTATHRLLHVSDQGGMSDNSGGEIYENDFYLDSWGNQSEGVVLEYRNAVFRDNYMICEGAALIGVRAGGAGGRYSKIYNNHIEVRPTRGFETEEGAGVPAPDVYMAIALSGGNYGTEIYNNYIEVYSGRYGKGRSASFWSNEKGSYVSVSVSSDIEANGIRVVNMMFDAFTNIHDNTIKAISKKNGRAACVVVTGGCQSDTLEFKNNKFISNWCGVIVSDLKHSTQWKGEQDGGRNAVFINNTFIKEEKNDGYKIIRCGWDTIDSNAMFLNNKYEGGAAADDILFDGKKGEREILIGSMSLAAIKDEKGKPVIDAKVELVLDKSKLESVSYSTVAGTAGIPVVNTVYTPKAKIPVLSHKIRVSKEGYDNFEIDVKPGDKIANIVLKEGFADPEAVIKWLSEKYSDKAKQEAEWDWLHAPLTSITENSAHFGVTSASVYWQTDGRAWGYVEYGEDFKYGIKTQPFEKPNFAHLHHIKGLKKGAKYHYRMVSIGVDGKKVLSEDKTISTVTDKGMKILTGNPPYNLNEKGTYLLTNDASCNSGFGVSVSSSGVTLEMDGHTIVYGAAQPSGVPGQGIYGTGVSNFKIFNGIIREGPHDAAYSHGVSLVGCKNYELAYLRVEVKSFLTGVLYLRKGSNSFDIHHNLLWDRGHAYANRHQQNRTIDMADGGGADSKFHHNMVVAARNQSISGGGPNSEYFENTVELVGHSTNSAAIAVVGAEAKVHHNRIIARGEHPHGIWGSPGVKYFSNKIDSMTDMCVSYEYGTLGGVGFRTNYSRNYSGMELSDNVMVVRAMEDTGRDFVDSGSWLFWLADMKGEDSVLFKNNTFVSMVYGNAKTKGLAHCSTSPNIVYEGNTIISNYCCVTFGTHRGDGMNSQWINNTFVKIGNNREFRTFKNERGKCTGNKMTGSIYKGGASLDFSGFLK